MGFLARFCADPVPQPSPRTRNLASAEEKNVWERERDCVDRRRANIHKGGQEGVEEGEEKTSVQVKPHCYLNSREIRLPRTPARREA